VCPTVAVSPPAYRGLALVGKWSTAVDPVNALAVAEGLIEQEAFLPLFAATE
jgi:hypothetical protein